MLSALTFSQLSALSFSQLLGTLGLVRIYSSFKQQRRAQKHITNNTSTAAPPPRPTRADLALDDLHSYDPVAMAWTDLSAFASETPPSPRAWHGFTAAGGRLYVHGGLGNIGNRDGRGRLKLKIRLY